MATRWTNGEWKFVPLRAGYEVINEKDQHVCVVLAGPNAKANARLLSAAKDLYDALVVCSECLRDDQRDPELGQANAAIQKATGGPSVRRIP